MKGLLRKLEQEFKNEGVDGPTVTAKFHQIELLNELIDLLDVKLNGMRAVILLAYSLQRRAVVETVVEVVVAVVAVAHLLKSDELRIL